MKRIVDHSIGPMGLLGLSGLLLTGAVSGAEDTNALRDPSFEQGLPAEQGGWHLFGGRFTADQARDGQRSLFDAAFEGQSGSYQELPAKPGSRWRLTGYGMTPAPLRGAPAFGLLQLSFFDAQGKDLGTVETAGQRFPALTSNRIDASSPSKDWIRLDTGIGTAPEGTATIQAFTLYVDHAFNLQGAALAATNFQGVYFDDLHLCELAAEGDPPRCRPVQRAGD